VIAHQRLNPPSLNLSSNTGPAIQQRLRILFLAPQPFFEVRGTPLAVRALVGALTKLGHQVDLLTYPQGENMEMPGLRHRRSLRLPVGRVRPGPSAAKLLLDIPFMAEAVWRMAFGRYDVVHAVEEAAHLIAPFARILRVPYVADVDSSITDQLRYSGFASRGPLPWLAEVLERHALRNAAAVVTVCTSLTESVRARAPQARIFQIEDPPLVEAATVHGTAATAVRASLGLSGNPVVLYSGNFEPYQGVELLVDAAAKVPSAQFVFMGGEPAEIAAMKERARARSVADRCVFTGKRPPEELPRFLGLADVLVSPRCRGTNTPFKLYTYMASGKPIVASRISSHTQLLDDTVALLVEPTPAGLASGIEETLNQPREAASRAVRAGALLDREYSAERYLEKVAAAYGVLLTSAQNSCPRE
jgi:glycosyltransferase involved in cell wall biosynthesis